MKRIAAFLAALVLLSACAQRPRIVPIDALSPTRTPRAAETEAPTPEPLLPVARVDESGTSVYTRYNPTFGYTRQAADAGSFSSYLQNLPLKVSGSEVQLHNGNYRDDKDYAAVIDMPVISKNEHGAGAIAHLRAQYHYAHQEYARITFKLNDGFSFSFDEWRAGKRLKFVENRTEWSSGNRVSDDEDNFKEYLAAYFAYSSMNSLIKDMSEVEVEDRIRIGDIFVTTGDNPRAVIVVDSAVAEDGAQQVLLAEGGKPAQQMRLLANPFDSALSPWFAVDLDTMTIRIDSAGTTLACAAADGKSLRYKFLTGAN